MRSRSSSSTARVRAARVAVGALLAAILAPGLAAAAEARPNLLLVTVDTLRADFLGCYGFLGQNTPTIDRLASQGLLFEDTITVIGKTGPAFASLFSSLYPPTHGARRNGVRMRDDVPVLAESLRAAGYTTGAFISNWTLKSHLAGTHRGFDHYDEVFNRARNSFGAVERDAPDVTAAALRWLEALPAGEPVFLWVHYSEPHSPYDMRAQFGPRGTDPGVGDNPKSKRYKYSSEVGFVDTWIGNLIGRAQRRLRPDSTLLVFLSDHGESLGEHDYWGHGKNTHWPNLRIPLILRGPGIPAGRRVSAGASIVDVLPTILDYLRLAPLPGAAGRSLTGAWNGHAGGDSGLRYAMGERSTALTKKGRHHYNHPLVISAQNQDAKAVYDFGDGKLSYYDLRTDPVEDKPLTQPPIEMRPALGRQLSDWYKSLKKYEQDGGELTPQDIEQLKSLGYLVG